MLDVHLIIELIFIAKLLNLFQIRKKIVEMN